MKARTLITPNKEMLGSDAWIGHPVDVAVADVRKDGPRMWKQSGTLPRSCKSNLTLKYLCRQQK